MRKSAKITLVKAEIEKESKQQKKIYVEGEQPVPFNYSTLAELYTMNTWHQRCIDVKAILTAGLGWEIIKIKDDNNEEYERLQKFLEDHSRYAGQTLVETLIDFQKNYEIYGNAYLEVVRNNAGEIVEIYNMNAKNTRIAIEKGVKYAVQRDMSKTVKFAPFGARKRGENEYIHLKNTNPISDIYGIPEYVGAISAIVLDKSAVEFNIRRFDNNAIPDLAIIVTGGELTKESIDSIKDFWRANFKGLENVGKTLILEIQDPQGKIQVEKLFTELRDASFRYLRNDNRDEIISAHGVPPRLVGIVTPGALGGVGEAREQLRILEETILQPRRRRLEFIFNNMILKDLNIVNYGIRFNKIDITDITQDARYYAELVNAGIITPEEARQELGYLSKSQDLDKIINFAKKLRKLKNIIEKFDDDI